ncbi:MAG: CHAT domain-containing protein, partial [Bacteroidota bacterium]
MEVRTHLFFAFSNHSADPLEDLLHERKEIQQALHAFPHQQCISIDVADVADLNDITHTFLRHHNQISIFHYAGHAAGNILDIPKLNQDVRGVKGDGIAALSSVQHALQLVFLNGCSTRAQVTDLLAAGVPAVIATNDKIPDLDSAGFAAIFYIGLANGMNIRDAFQSAAAWIKSQHTFLPEIHTEVREDALLWGLYVHPDHDTALDWKLPSPQSHLFAHPHGFEFINQAWWDDIRRHTDTDRLAYYYTRTDSSKERIQQIVADEHHIRNESQARYFHWLLQETKAEYRTLIKVLSRGGEGKSTFLYQLAKEYCHAYPVFLIQTLKDDTAYQIRAFSDFLFQSKNLKQKTLLLFMDDVQVHEEQLRAFLQDTERAFRGIPFILVVGERHFRYRGIDEIEKLEQDYFDETHEISFKTNTSSKAKILPKLLQQLDVHLESADLAEITSLFLDAKRTSLAESCINVIRELDKRQKVKYTFDWDDWAQFVDRQPAPKASWHKLYPLIACFYQFGHRPTIDFCARQLGIDSYELYRLLSDNPNEPIYIFYEKYLILRHELLATWYFEDNKRLILSKALFRQFLEKVDTEFAKDLLIWTTKSREFLPSPLSKLIAPNQDKHEVSHFLVNFYRNYLADHPKEKKIRTELSKIYQKQGKWKEAEEILLDLLSLNQNNLQARTELSKIYQKQGKWMQAEEILLASLKIDPKGLHPRTELSKIYQK